MPEETASITISASDYEKLKERLYNLTLYLNYIEDFHPVLYRKLLRRFSGMPGYAATELVDA